MKRDVFLLSSIFRTKEKEKHVFPFCFTKETKSQRPGSKLHRNSDATRLSSGVRSFQRHSERYRQRCESFELSLQQNRRGKTKQSKNRTKKNERCFHFQVLSIFGLNIDLLAEENQIIEWS